MIEWDPHVTGWSASGLPEQGFFRGLLFNPAAEVLVVLFEPKSDPPVRRLYWRKRTETAYQQLGTPGPQVSFDSPVTCSKAALLYFNVHQYTKYDAGVAKLQGKPASKSSWGGDWLGIYRANLTSGEVQPVFHAEHLKEALPTGRAWVSSVLSAWDDGSGVYCTIGFETELRGPASGTVNGPEEIKGMESLQLIAGSHVNYYLCGLEFATRRIERILPLKGVFL